MWNDIGYFAARQLINYSFFMMGLCAALWFARTVASQMTTPGWYTRPEVRGAIALCVLFTGETIARGWTILYLMSVSTKRDPFDIKHRYEIAIFGATLAIMGIACTLRVFTRSNAEWVWSLLFTAIFVILMMLIDGNGP